MKAGRQETVGSSRRSVARDSITLLRPFLLVHPARSEFRPSYQLFSILPLSFLPQHRFRLSDLFTPSSSSHSQDPTLNNQQERKHTTTTMEFMSNLGGGAQADRPSLFELIAQDKMREMLEPALRYVIAVKSPFSLSFQAPQYIPYHGHIHRRTKDKLLTLLPLTFLGGTTTVRFMHNDTPAT